MLQFVWRNTLPRVTHSQAQHFPVLLGTYAYIVTFRTVLAGIGQQIIENRLKLLQVRLHHKRLRDVDRNHYALVL